MFKRKVNEQETTGKYFLKESQNFSTLKSVVESKMVNYLVKRRSLLFLLKCIDVLTPKLYAPHEKKYRRILLCNTAHLGDVVNASYVIHAIKHQYPNAKIGFLLDKNAKELIDVDFIHTISHYKHSRSKKHFLVKMVEYWISASKAVWEIRKLKYDVAIDLYLYLGNSAFLLFLTNVSYRIGYTSGGFGNFFTERLDYLPNQGQIIEYYIPLLKRLNIDQPILKGSLTTSKPGVSLPDRYIVVHPGCGDKIKYWETDYWKEVAGYLISQNIYVVITGAGDRDVELVKHILISSPFMMSLVNQLSLRELCYVIGQAKLLIGCDSLAVHIAAALNVPCIQIMTGIHPNQLWQAFGNKTIAIQKEIECVSCDHSKACSEMSCIKGISPSTIIQTIQSIQNEIT